jgi:hypothetical protein
MLSAQRGVAGLCQETFDVDAVLGMLAKLAFPTDAGPISSHAEFPKTSAQLALDVRDLYLTPLRRLSDEEHEEPMTRKTCGKARNRNCYLHFLHFHSMSASLSSRVAFLNSYVHAKLRAGFEGVFAAASLCGFRHTYLAVFPSTLNHMAYLYRLQVRL